MAHDDMVVNNGTRAIENNMVTAAQSHMLLNTVPAQVSGIQKTDEPVTSPRNEFESKPDNSLSANLTRPEQVLRMRGAGTGEDQGAGSAPAAASSPEGGKSSAGEKEAAGQPDELPGIKTTQSIIFVAVNVGSLAYHPANHQSPHSRLECPDDRIKWLGF